MAKLPTDPETHAAVCGDVPARSDAGLNSDWLSISPNQRLGGASCKARRRQHVRFNLNRRLRRNVMTRYVMCDH